MDWDFDEEKSPQWDITQGEQVNEQTQGETVQPPPPHNPDLEPNPPVDTSPEPIAEVTPTPPQNPPQHIPSAEQLPPPAQIDQKQPEDDWNLSDNREQKNETVNEKDQPIDILPEENRDIASPEQINEKIQPEPELELKSNPKSKSQDGWDMSDNREQQNGHVVQETVDEQPTNISPEEPQKVPTPEPKVPEI